MHFLKSIINKYINTSPQNAADAIPKIKKKKKNSNYRMPRDFITISLLLS